MNFPDPLTAGHHVPVAVAAPCVLVVEDESYLATLIENVLISAGYRVLKAGRVEVALAIVAGDIPIDAALLDVNLNGTEVFPVAVSLRERGIPFVFASGYGREGLPAEFNDRPMVQKPYLPDALTAALSRCLQARESS